MFHQGSVTLQLSAEECLALARACRAGAEAPEPEATPADVAAIEALERGLRTCARVVRRQHPVAVKLSEAQSLRLVRWKQPAITVIE